jgi:GntR family transcriptional regulator, transcriptional repressor for pyruvate dehydrogenase complex
MSIGLQPLASARRADGVFEQLRARILSGAFAAGARLPNERELADRLDVNRASVREAVKRLEFLELVEVRHGQGTFVRAPSDSSALQIIETLLRDPRTVTRELLVQILEFRRHVSLHVVELAARNRTEEQLARARELLAQERLHADAPAAALDLDVELNRLLGEATGNLMYRLLTNLFSRLVRRLGPLYYNAGRDATRSVTTHHELFAAVEARDPDGARALLERMLDYSEEAILGEVAKLEAKGLIGPDAGREAP